MAEIMDVSRWQRLCPSQCSPASGKIDGVMIRVLGSKDGKGTGAEQLDLRGDVP